MSSEGTSNFEERLSPAAADFFESLLEREQDHVEALIVRMREDPSVDGASIFDVTAPPAVWRVLVDMDFTLYCRVNGRRLEIDAIRRTVGTIQDMLRYPFKSDPPRPVP